MSAAASESIHMQREAARRWCDEQLTAIQTIPAWLVLQVGWQPQSTFRVWQISGLDTTAWGVARLASAGHWDLSGRVVDELLRRIRFERPMTSVIAHSNMRIGMEVLLQEFFDQDKDLLRDHPQLFGDDNFLRPSSAVHSRFIAHIDVLRFFA